MECNHLHIFSVGSDRGWSYGFIAKKGGEKVMRISSKLLAGLAIFVLLLGVSSQLANHAFAYTSADKYAHAQAIAKAVGEQAAKDLAAQQKNKIISPNSPSSSS